MRTRSFTVCFSLPGTGEIYATGEVTCVSLGEAGSYMEPPSPPDLEVEPYVHLAFYDCDAAEWAAVARQGEAVYAEALASLLDRAHEEDWSGCE